MVWSVELSQGNEQDKIATFAVPYLQGRALDLGCGMRKVWPGLIGIDNASTFGGNTVADIPGDISDLSMFGDATMDAVFSSHVLEDFPRERVPTVLEEWARVLKIGGYLVLYVPNMNLYPKCGDPHANPHHKWDVFPGDVEAVLKANAEASEDMGGYGWTLLESEERSEGDEYSLFIVVQKGPPGWREDVWQRNPDGRKRALVIRYGGIGDMIMTASVLPGLKKQGYHVTLNCRAETASVLEHDPHIDAWIKQKTDFVPNLQLGPYWKTLAQRYDKIVNLCESVEASLLLLADRLQSQYPHRLREEIAGGVNYVQRTHDIADVPHDFAPRFFATPYEKAWAAKTKAQCDGPVILWVLAGSSPHKVWPWTHIVASWLLQRTPAHIFFSADGGIGKLLQDGILGKLAEDDADPRRIYPIAGQWSIRQSLAFAQVADVVIGPETGVLNAVCMEPMPKVVFLSHSSETNLTRDWRNTTVLKPEAERAPCYPCHMLHMNWDNCHQDEATSAALCAAGISPDRVFEALALALGAKKVAA